VNLINALKNGIQMPASCNMLIFFRIERIKADIDPFHTGMKELPRKLRKEDAVGCKADVPEVGDSFRLTRGSPPVILIFLIPVPTATLTMRDISSYRRISSWPMWDKPSLGIQYMQRRLQRSVIEILR
jgi:hypothetical protein